MVGGRPWGGGGAGPPPREESGNGSCLPPLTCATFVSFGDPDEDRFYSPPESHPRHLCGRAGFRPFWESACCLKLASNGNRRGRPPAPAVFFVLWAAARLSLQAP